MTEREREREIRKIEINSTGSKGRRWREREGEIRKIEISNTGSKGRRKR